MRIKVLARLAMAILAAAAVPRAAAQEVDPSAAVTVCYWSGEDWRYATQDRNDADSYVADGRAVYPDANGDCPPSAPWAYDLDSDPQATYCYWFNDTLDPGQGWLLGIADSDFVARQVASDEMGAYVWPNLDGSCPDVPHWTAWDGPWVDELGVVHYPEG